MTTTQNERLASRNAGFIRQNEISRGRLPDKSGVPVIASTCVPLGTLALIPSASALITLFFVSAIGQTPARAADRLPPARITIAQADREELSAEAAALRKEIDALARELRSRPQLLKLLPDVEIFHKAVDWALRYDEFFETKQVAFAKTL